jgi:hypothetical protein
LYDRRVARVIVSGMESTQPKKRRPAGPKEIARPPQGFMTRNRGTICLVGVAASGWQIYQITTASGASQALVFMQYTLLAIMVVATLVSGAQWLTMK